MARDPIKTFARWKANITSPSTKEKITSGVDSVNTAPGELAAQHLNDYLNGVVASQAKWERNVKAVTLEEWRTDMIQKGYTNMVSGANRAKTKVELEKFFTEFLPFAEAVKVYARKLPTGTFTENTEKSRVVQGILHEWYKGSNMTVAQAIAKAQAAGNIPGTLPAP